MVKPFCAVTVRLPPRYWPSPGLRKTRVTVPLNDESMTPGLFSTAAVTVNGVPQSIEIGVGVVKTICAVTWVGLPKISG